ncbi:capsule assembly Wzi family protein [Larkinella soli]|uniref:capsule assembly Wzi family protein n=1 Tax=Larkinella soli TaxID=1770527 RepID=UPI000FFCAD3F|nr:capsule assembly Wzi family protein [Larkinella soli]
MKHLYGFFLLFLFHYSAAQRPASSRITPFAEAGLLAASAERTPFWLRANQFGIVPARSPAATLRLGVFGSVALRDTQASTGRRPWTLTYRAEIVGNAGKQSTVLLPEAYVRVAHRSLELVAGRRREIIGLVDSTLSSGSFAWSGNALPMPKIRFGTAGFTPLWRNGWLGVNAFIAHGWFADTWFMQHSFLHEKSTLWRLGKPAWGFRLYAGINHHAQWGGRSDYLDRNLAVDGQLPGRLRDFGNVFLTLIPRDRQNPRYTYFDGFNRFGNHLGSYDFGLELPGKTTSLLFYHQHPYEDSSGLIFANLPDGLSGIRLQRRPAAGTGFRLNTLLLEVLLTRSQSGSFLDLYGLGTLRRTEGRDNYFNHSQYREAWTYRGQVLGTPFITLQSDLRREWWNQSGWRIINNRVQVYHLGFRAAVGRRVEIEGRFSYSLNYGTYDQALPGSPGQFSSLLRATLPVRWLGGSVLTGALALDQGRLYTNSAGTYLGLRKTWGRNSG